MVNAYFFSVVFASPLSLSLRHSVMCFQPKSLHGNSTRSVGAAAAAAVSVCTIVCVWVGVCLHMCACGVADAKRRLKLA